MKVPSLEDRALRFSKPCRDTFVGARRAVPVLIEAEHFHGSLWRFWPWKLV
jgi:hypothetical protein